MKPRTSSGGVCSVGRTPYFHNSASTSSRYVKTGRSGANGVLHSRQSAVEPKNPARPLQRLGERLGPIDRFPDDRLDDFRELRRMRGREEDALRPLDAEIADRGVRI